MEIQILDHRQVIGLWKINRDGSRRLELFQIYDIVDAERFGGPGPRPEGIRWTRRMRSCGAGGRP